MPTSAPILPKCPHWTDVGIGPYSVIYANHNQ